MAGDFDTTKWFKKQYLEEAGITEDKVPIKENIENVKNYLEDYARTLDQEGKLKLADELEKQIQFLRRDNGKIRTMKDMYDKLGIEIPD